MNHRRLHSMFLAAVLIGLLGTSNARAALIQIAPDLELQTQWLPGVFDDVPGQFSNEALSIIHDSLADSGISTDGSITILGLETDAGITLAFLIDGNGIGSGFFDSTLSFQTTAPIGLTAWINDQPGDISGNFEGSSGNQISYGLFSWDSALEGDAFAWSGLQQGDEINALFGVVSDSTFPGLLASDTFQFVSADNEGWSVVLTESFTSAGLFGFTAGVVPTPGTLAVLGMLVAVRRRRRR